MRTVTKEELTEILTKHARWRRGEADGARADLADANLARAYLAGAYLADAYLAGANLAGADLADANLARAYLAGADLAGANLAGAIMPDGRRWEDYRADHLAGICTTLKVREKAIAAWGKHSWRDCPMHCALGIDSAGQASDPNAVAAWVALYDAKLLERPKTSTKNPPRGP